MCPGCASRSLAPFVPCADCRADLAPASDRCVGGGIIVRSAFAHRGVARRSVHRLKYEAAAEVIPMLSLAMSRLVPPEAVLLVPVPRARYRVWRYGIDPADALAVAVGRRTGIGVARALRAGWWWPHHAGRTAGGRAAARFQPTNGSVPRSGVVLVDDVLTTGATLQAAATALGGGEFVGLTATAAGTLVALDKIPRRGPGEAGWR